MRERDDDLLPPYFYDNPRLPGPNTLRSLDELMLSPYDAGTVLMNAIADGRRLSSIQRRALQEIIDKERGGKQDFLQIVKRIEEEEYD